MANKKKNAVEEETVKNKKNNTKKTDVKKNELKKESSKKVAKEEIESPIKNGMSETTRGMIIGMIIMGLISVIIILLILGKKDDTNKVSGDGSNSSNVVASEDYKKLTAADKKKGSEEIQKFYQYFDKDKPTLIVFASTSCGWCELQKPIVERIGKMYDLDYLYMDATKLEGNEVYDVISYLGIEGTTPTSLVVQNGKVLSTISGMNEGKAFVEFLVDGGVLSKGSTYKDEENLIVVTYEKFEELLKGKDTTVVLFDFYAISSSVCGERCLDQRLVINNIAKENNIPVYHLPLANTTDDFIDKLGEWGYSTDDYKENKSVGIPLLMFVRDGKLVWYQNGNMTEDDIRTEMKNHKIIK